MRLLILLSLVLITSCAANKKSGAQFGTTTLAELVILKGEPLKEEAIPVEGGKVLLYGNDEKFQIKDNIVTHSIRNPKDDESNLIYWKHAFKNCATTSTKISEKTEGHQLAEYILKCDAEGTGVVYRDNSEIVSRVVEYEKK